MTLKNEDLVDIIINEIEKGIEISQLIEKYPDLSSEIREYALLAQYIRNIPKPKPQQTAIETMLNKIREQADPIKTTAAVSNNKKHVTAHVWRRLVPVFGVLVLAAISGWVGMLFSQESLPGDFLYPIKIGSERIQYILAFNTHDKASLHVKFAGKRTNELWKRFLEHKTFDPVLLTQMQKETAEAFQLKENIAQDLAPALSNQIDDVNHQQIRVLTQIKPLAFSGDTAIIIQAINRCCELDKCVHNNNINNKTRGQDLMHECPCGNGTGNSK